MATTTNRATISGVVAALEQCLTAIQGKHPTVAKNITVVVASKGRGRNSNFRGYHHADRWDLGRGGRAAELFIAAEYLKGPARRVFTTLLHETVHSACFSQGIADTSKDGKYHNRRFEQMALAFGLKTTREPGVGIATPDIEPETYREYEAEIKNLSKATKVFRHADIEVIKPKNRNLIKATCDCEEDNSIRASRRRIEKGIICSECGTDFEGETP